jgi:hypothetical protein
MNPNLAALLGLASLGVWAAQAVALDLGDGRIHLRNEDYDVATGPRSELREDGLLPGERDAWIVVFEAPSGENVKADLEGTGAKIVGTVPSNAYVVRATGEAADLLRDLERVRRVDRFRPIWKVSPELLAGRAPGLLSIEVFDGESPLAIAERLRELGASIEAVHEGGGVRRIIVQAPEKGLLDLARVREVEWIEEAPKASLRNDIVRWVIQSGLEDETPLHDRGLFGEGEIIGHIDGPIAHMSCFFLDPDDPTPGPSHRKLVAYHGRDGFGQDTHGTHTAGTACGDAQPATGATQNGGMAPLARLAHTRFDEVTTMNSNLAELLEAAHGDGARIHTNSWGVENQTAYTSLTRDVDVFTRNYEEDLVVFAISNSGTIKTPENAKNVLAVGASGRPPDQNADGPGGRGPTSDGRRKPDVLAPGVSTFSASTSSSSCVFAPMTGTSMAAPAVAGGAALVREYFRKGFYPSGRPNSADAITPTGALLRAMMVSSAVDLTGVTGYPSAGEGWGRILLDDALFFRGDSRGLWIQDRRHEFGLATGEVHTYTLEILSDTFPLELTLAFNDVPGLLAAALPVVNDLDLELEGPRGLFLGNVFDADLGESIAGGAPDPLNNVERIILAQPAIGAWTIRVRGRDVPLGPQGYALVATARFGQTAEFFFLAKIAPNPFSSSALISFGLPAAARVSIKVHDATGRLVRRLFQDEMEAGIHEIPWDGRDQNGRSVSNGVYFFHLESPSFEASTKGVLLR